MGVSTIILQLQSVRFLFYALFPLITFFSYFCREFRNMVRRIFICSKEQVKNMSSGSKQLTSIEVEGDVVTPVSPAV